MTAPGTLPQRVLGVSALAFAVFNITVGAGIFGLPALAAAALGPAAILGYLVCAVLMAMVGLCFAEAGSRVTDAGGPFAYASVSFGSVAGGVVGTLTWFSGVTASGAVANLWIQTLAGLFPALQSDTPRIVALVAFYGALAIINIRGARQGSTVSVAVAIVKIVPLIVIVAGGLFHVHPENLHWTATPAPAQVGNTTALLFFAFVGVEMGLCSSAEVRAPNRTIPAAILVAILGVSALYVAIQLVAQGVLGTELAQSPAPLVAIAQVILGPWGSLAMTLAILASTSGYLVADALCTPRAIYALAARGQLPRRFAALHLRFGTPAPAIALYLALCALLAASGSFRTLAVYTSAVTLVVYAVCLLGLLRLRARGIEQGGRSFRAPGGALLPLAATGLIGWLLASLTREELLATLALVLVLTAAYAGHAAYLRRSEKRPDAG